MKKLLIVFLLIACSLTSVTSVNARGRRDYDQKRHPQKYDRHSPKEKSRARSTIRETAGHLSRAQAAARTGHYSYGLGKAYAHQEQARDFYFNGRYERAIAHSLRARDIALYIIKENREGRYRAAAPPPRRYAERHDDIDDQLSIRVVDDKVAIKLKINLD